MCSSVIRGRLIICGDTVPSLQTFFLTIKIFLESGMHTWRVRRAPLKRNLANLFTMTGFWDTKVKMLIFRLIWTYKSTFYDMRMTRYTIVANSSILSLCGVKITFFRPPSCLSPGIFSEGIFMPFICQKLCLFEKFEVNFHVLTPLIYNYRSVYENLTEFARKHQCRSVFSRLEASIKPILKVIFLYYFCWYHLK